MNDQLGLLREWGMWGVLVALLLGVHQLVKQRGRTLWYRVLVNQPLVTLRDDLIGNLRITVMDRPVKGVHIVAVAFVNAGGTPIRPEDFAEPIIIMVNEGARLLDVLPLQSYHKIVRTDVRFDETNLVIAPVLLNPDEAVGFRLLIEGFKPPLQLSARIAEVGQVHESVIHPSDWWAGFRSAVRLAIVTTVLAALWVWGHRRTDALGVLAVISGFGAFWTCPASVEGGYLRCSRASAERAFRAHSPRPGSHADSRSRLCGHLAKPLSRVKAENASSCLLSYSIGEW